jgi:hypothetical protein
MAASSYICKQCGHIGRPVNETPGNFLLEIFLWCLMILPGLLYTLWRVTNKTKACPSCKASSSMIPLDSPVGKKLSAELGNKN